MKNAFFAAAIVAGTLGTYFYMDSVNEESLKKMLLCDGNVTYLAQKADAPEGCLLVAESLPPLELVDPENNVWLDQLREKCAPCEITMPTWGPCPHCLDENLYPGGCAKACAPQPEQ